MHEKRRGTAERIRTTIYLDAGIKHLCEANAVNLSDLVSTLLSNYFSVRSIDQVREKIKDKNAELQVLEYRLKSMTKEGAAETDADAMSNEAWDVIEYNWIQYNRKEYDSEVNLGWITGPANMKLLKICNMDPHDALKKLEALHEN